MTLQEVFKRMVAGKQVRLTDEGREFWTKPSDPIPNPLRHNGIKEKIGQWFFIQKIHHDNEVTLVGEYHNQLINVKIEHLKF